MQNIGGTFTAGREFPYPEIADIWVEDIRNIEIAELTTMNLFQHLPYAPAKSFHWIARGRIHAGLRASSP